MNEYYYEPLRDGLLRELKRLDKYKKVNNYLKKNDWFFISPIFFQGFELDILLEYSTNEKSTKSDVTKIIFRKFYNLNWTASFIEGYCKRCKHIEPFVCSIEHSVILAFQRDYEGATKTLIPIIEGILRRYLCSEVGMEMHSIRFQDIRKSISLLKDDIINNYRELLRKYPIENNQFIIFSDEQINTLIQLEEQYFSTWIEFFQDFLDNSFYLNTTKQEITNQVNRHAILHEFGLGISYSLENYLKVYFSLQFLTWIFLRKEQESVLSELSGYRYLEKAISYHNIISLSQKLYFEKHILYKEYSSYSQEIYHSELNAILDELLPPKKMFRYKSLRLLHKLLWRKKVLNK